MQKLEKTSLLRLAVAASEFLYNNQGLGLRIRLWDVSRRICIANILVLLRVNEMRTSPGCQGRVVS